MCPSVYESTYENNFYENFHLLCDGDIFNAESLLYFSESTFDNETSNKYLLYALNSNMNIEYCNFSRCSVKDTILYTDVNKTNSFSLINCLFNECFNKHQNISSSNIINTSSFEVNIYNTQIHFEDKNHSCRGICIYGSQRINIEQVYISNSNVGENEGAAILASETNVGELIISHCEFLNCGTSNYAISARASRIDFNYSTITFDRNEYDQSCGGISILSQNRIAISHAQFLRTSQKSALHIESILEIYLDSCDFVGCYNANNTCLYISSLQNIQINSFSIRYTESIGKMNYLGYINCINCDFHFTTFSNNSCDSLYGGGIGLFLNASAVNFYFSKFINNSAYQNRLIKRPSSGIENYFNGDGGAFQFGYTCEEMNTNIAFFFCEFSDNFAYKNGGAIAIQTFAFLEIIHCTFTNNTANCKNLLINNSPELTEFNNFYHLKTEGKGGAIYYNPTFWYSGSSDTCSFPESFDTKFRISENNFDTNIADDGYAIYFEGEVNFPFSFIEFKDNNFHDNFNPSNRINNSSIITGAVISSEIWTLDNLPTINGTNTFLYTEDIKVDDFRLVFRNGEAQTNKSSESICFTSSMKFSKSLTFTFSNAFSESISFTSSDQFSNSLSFTLSNKFSNSNIFAPSDKFSESYHFSSSDKFSNSNIFAPTDKFSESYHFSSSNKFSNSNIFAPTDILTEHYYFSSTDKFSNSNTFAPSDKFSESYYFSSSDKFSNNENVLNSDYINSLISSTSTYYGYEYETRATDEFTTSETFTFQHPTIYETKHNQIVTKSYVNSYVMKRSVLITLSYYASRSYSLYYDQSEGTFIYINSEYYYPSNSYYIIHYFSETYIPTYITIINNNKKSLSSEQLIGIVCGAVSAFFLIVYTIIFILRKNRFSNFHMDDFTFSTSESINDLENDNSNSNSNGNANSTDTDHIGNQKENSSDEADIDFWFGGY